MHECYVISLPDFFHFLIQEVLVLSRTSTYELAENLCELDWHTVFFTVRRRENNQKLKLLSVTKTRVHSLLVTFNVLRLYAVTELNQLMCAIFRILTHSILKFCTSLSNHPYW